MLFGDLALQPFLDSILAYLNELLECVLLAVQVVNLHRNESFLLLVGSQLHVLLECCHSFPPDPLLFIIPSDLLEAFLLLREFGPILETEVALLHQLGFMVAF